MADDPDVDLTRRDVIKAGAAATVGVSLAMRERSPRSSPRRPPRRPASSPAGRTRAGRRAREMIIPADDHSPGARAAKVAAYIDSQLAEAFDEADRTTWRDGLQLVDQLSQTMQRHAVPAIVAGAAASRC